jgi:transcriptional regulator with XRE-family HTH domain
MKPKQLRRLAEVRAQAADGTARSIRVNAGISLREVAAAVKANPSTLHRWETGECAPRGNRALAWAAMLDELAGARV